MEADLPVVVAAVHSARPVAAEPAPSVWPNAGWPEQQRVADDDDFAASSSSEEEEPDAVADAEVSQPSPRIVVDAVPLRLSESPVLSERRGTPFDYLFIACLAHTTTHPVFV